MSSVSSNPIPCGPCKQEKVNTKAYIWCYNCNEGLCSTCSGHHKKFGSTRDHKTIDIQTYKSYKPSIGAIKTKCDPHDQQFNLYCPSHLMPCCDECISNHHTKCTGIKSLTSVVEKTKIEQSKASIEKDIKSLLLFLNTTAVNRTSNIQKGEQQYKRLKESVGKIRKEINKHLDLLEKKLCKDADTVWSEEKAKLSGFSTEIEEKKKTLMEIQDDLHTVSVHSSKLQSFLWMHQIEQTVHQCQRYVEDMETLNYEISSDVDIKIEQNEQIEKILKEIKSLKSFGEVKVVKSQIIMNRETSVRREAQVELQGQPNIHNMTMNIETKININLGKEITDMICLMDGRVIVVEYWGKVNIYASDCKFQKQLPISDDALSVTQINQDTIAISCPADKAIKIYNMKNETVSKVIALCRSCYSLSYSNSLFAVGLCTDEIRILDFEGNTVTSIQVRSRSCLNDIVYCNDKVIFSDCIGRAVYCVDRSGEQIWQYNQDLEGPRALCEDMYGNIIVADFFSNRIIVISKDGHDSTVLISKGLKDTKYICYNNNSGFICDCVGRNLTKFNISYNQK
ncbi:uncharacterized protein [Mytilus edulis]|uniref:uncharacterized protein n=1 Tax=Mytilus edulis TaxID=6550 RepID=UPI0039EFAE79